MSTRTPTYEELMARSDIQFVAEHNGHIYVKLPPVEYYDNTIWKVDKKTHNVSYMMFTEFLAIADRAEYIRGSLFSN